jgi:hypothetical protein
MGRGEIYTKFWLEKPKRRDHSEDLGVREKIILERILGIQRGKVWSVYFWLRIGTSGGLL